MLEDDPESWREIEQWTRAAEVVSALAHSRLGLMGHYYSGMLDISTDLVQLSGRFGVHVEMLEVDELSAVRANIGEAEVRQKLEELRRFFEIGKDCGEDELRKAAVTAAALDQFVSKHGLDMLAYYYKGSGIPKNEETMSSIVLGPRC